MSKIAGYNGEIRISGDGAASWHHINFVTNADLNFNINTNTETTWDDRGFVNEVPNTITGNMSLEGLYDSGDHGQGLLEKHALNKQKLRIKFWRDHRDQSKYYEFNGYVISFSTPQNVDNRALFNVELSIEGVSLKTVKINN